MTILFWRVVNGPRQRTRFPHYETMSTLSDWLPKESLKGRPQKTPGRVPSGTIWPHDEFSLGYAAPEGDASEWHENPLYVTERAMQHIRDDWNLARFPLDLSDTSNSHRSPKRGLKGITGYGRNMVKAVGALMNRQYPRHRVTFATVTLPEMTEVQRREVVLLWPELTRQLLQWLRRQLAAAAMPEVVCAVTEVQPRRLQASGSGYLHWHLIWLNRPAKSGAWSVDPVEMYEWIHTMLTRKLGTSNLGRVNVDVKPVKGEVARYMAKYMSKGSDVLAEAQADWGEDATPSTWWNMTKPARDWVKANTLKGRKAGEIIEQTLEYVWATGDTDPIAFIRHIEIDIDGVLITVGYRGRFEQSVADRLRGVITSLDIERCKQGAPA